MARIFSIPVKAIQSKQAHHAKVKVNVDLYSGSSWTHL